MREDGAPEHELISELITVPSTRAAWLLDWVEFGSTTGSTASEATRLNWSRNLTPEQVAQYHPFDAKYGIGSLGGFSWADWPDSFRGCAAFRKVGDEYVAYAIRGDPEFSGSPWPRHYFYGLWLILPAEWFDRAARHDQTAVDRLADQLYSVFHLLCRRAPSRTYGTAQPPLAIERHPLGYAAPLRGVCERAELAGAVAQRRAGSSALSEPDRDRQFEVIREPAPNQPEDEAAKLTQMVTAAYLDERFAYIAGQGIAIYPPAGSHQRFVWVVPRPPTPPRPPPPPTALPTVVVSAADAETKLDETHASRLFYSLLAGGVLLSLAVLVGIGWSLWRYHKSSLAQQIEIATSNVCKKFIEKPWRYNFQNVEEIEFRRCSKLIKENTNFLNYCFLLQKHDECRDILDCESLLRANTNQKQELLARRLQEAEAKLKSFMEQDELCKP